MGVMQRAGQRTAQSQHSAHACQHAVARLGFERQRKKHRRGTLHRANHQKALLQAQAVQQHIARHQWPQRRPGHIGGIDQRKTLALLAHQVLRAQMVGNGKDKRQHARCGSHQQ